MSLRTFEFIPRLIYGQKYIHLSQNDTFFSLVTSECTQITSRLASSNLTTCSKRRYKTFCYYFPFRGSDIAKRGEKTPKTGIATFTLLEEMMWNACEVHVKYMWNFHLVFHIQFHTSVKNNVKSPCENHVKWCPPFHIIKCCEKDMWNCEMCAVKSCTIDHVNLTCEIYKNIHRKLWKKVCETFNIFKNQENVT